MWIMGKSEVIHSCWRAPAPSSLSAGSVGSVGFNFSCTWPPKTPRITKGSQRAKQKSAIRWFLHQKSPNFLTKIRKITMTSPKLLQFLCLGHGEEILWTSTLRGQAADVDSQILPWIAEETLSMNNMANRYKSMVQWCCNIDLWTNMLIYLPWWIIFDHDWPWFITINRCKPAWTNVKQVWTTSWRLWERIQFYGKVMMHFSGGDCNTWECIGLKALVISSASLQPWDRRFDNLNLGSINCVHCSVLFRSPWPNLTCSRFYILKRSMV